MPMYWYELKCKECEETTTNKEGLTKLEIMAFVTEHLASCYDFFEVTHKLFSEEEI